MLDSVNLLLPRTSGHNTLHELVLIRATASFFPLWDHTNEMIFSTACVISLLYNVPKTGDEDEDGTLGRNGASSVSGNRVQNRLQTVRVCDLGG